MSKPPNPSASLEREVILAVVILYLGICAVMLGLHFLAPAGRATSSTSPSADAIAANMTTSNTTAPNTTGANMAALGR